MSESLSEPRHLLDEALRQRDAERYASTRRAYEAWYEATDFDIEAREPWPGFFESALFAALEGLEAADGVAFYRLRVWADANRGDERIREILDVLASTGRLGASVEPWPFRPPDAALALEDALRAGDARAVARIEAECGAWAESVGAPWPDVFLDELGLLVRSIETTDEGAFEGLCRWARESTDDRLWALRSLLTAEGFSSRARATS